MRRTILRLAEYSTYVLVDVLELSVVKLFSSLVAFHSLQETFFRHFNSEFDVLGCQHFLCEIRMVLQSLIQDIDDIPEQLEGVRSRSTEEVQISFIFREVRIYIFPFGFGANMACSA